MLNYFNKTYFYSNKFKDLFSLFYIYRVYVFLDFNYNYFNGSYMINKMTWIYILNFVWNKITINIELTNVKKGYFNKQIK